ncbi:MAG: ABC transporter ATP-binding protein, partial [Candidatus Dormibacteraceae bacterium]
MSPILQVRELRKCFEDRTAVDDISFEVSPGQILGLLGPNGAGKTTTIHMLLGLTRYDSGSINYFGLDFRRHRQQCLQRINFISAYNNLLNRLSVIENLRVFADLYATPNAGGRIDELANYFEVTHLLDQVYWSLSSGQRTRVNLVKSLLNHPELLLMDEPTASLDPDIADKTLSLIEELRARHQTAILFTSHNMSEVTRICDSVIFLQQGKIVAQDSPANLVKDSTSSTEVHLFLEPHVRNSLLGWLDQQKFIARAAGSHEVILT